MGDWRNPQTPGIGGINELTDAEEAWVQSAAAGTLFRDNEEPSGAINGTNVTFTLANTPNPVASLRIYLNGFYQVQGKDYNISGTTITYDEAPSSGSIHRAFYRTEP